MKTIMKKLLFLPLIVLLALTACQDEPKPDKSAIEKFTVNGVSFKMIKVKGGSLTMNKELQITPTAVLFQDSTLDVTVADFSIGQTEVTQALWLAVMGENPSYFSSSENWPEDKDRVFEDDLNRPVERVSSYDCQDFIAKLNELTGRHFRIPSEAEWEFAARGGNKTHGYPYAGSDNIDEVAWYRGNSDMTHPVGKKKPNELGLCDMSGNVSELCLDYVSLYTGYRPTIFQIVRGGSYHATSEVWSRGWISHDSGFGVRSSTVGLRLAE